jgi:hypothetical protein
MPPTNVEDLIAELTVEEKVSLLSGADGWHTQNIPRLGIGSLKVKSTQSIQPRFANQKSIDHRRTSRRKR